MRDGTSTERAAAPPIAHTALEDVMAWATGIALATFGLACLHAARAVTGGTAGLSLLLSYLVPAPFGALFAAVNVPFFLVGLRLLGRSRVLRALGAVVATSLLSPLVARLAPTAGFEPVFAVLFGNVCIGIGILILVRHRSSLGGFTLVALGVQARYGVRAGYVQLAFDAVVIVAAVPAVGPARAALSLAGAVLLNLVLAFNHRPGRYAA